MTVCLPHPRGTILRPLDTDDETLSRVFLSLSGKFAALLSDSILSVLCLSTHDPVILDSLDVSDVAIAAGSEYSHVEPSFREVVWSSAEDLLFASTENGLVQVLKIESVAVGEGSDADPDDPDMLTRMMHAENRIPFKLTFDTVLIIPVKDFSLVATDGCLIVVSKRTRMLYLIDWKNYKARAQRFLIPSTLDESPHSGSPCINSVLPQIPDMPEEELKEEPVSVIQALASDEGDALLLLYDNGFIRSFAVSKPSATMSTMVPGPPASCMAVEGSSLAIASASEPIIYIFKIDSACSFNLVSRISIPGLISGLSWSMGFLAVSHAEGISLLNQQCHSFLWHHSSDKSYGDLRMSLSHRLIVALHKDSGRVELLPLATSGDLATKCHSPSQTNLMIARDGLRLLSFPSTQWRFIPLPWMYMLENGPIREAAVQINNSSRFVVVAGTLGLALWSGYTSSLTSASRREGKWEVLAAKSQEATVGRVELVGFISETVFFTKSYDCREIRLWSVLKRLDLAYILSSTKLHADDVDVSAVDSARGILTVVYKNEQRIDILKLFPNATKETYSLELVSTLPSDFPPSLRKLVIVSSPRTRLSTVIGLSKSGEVFLRTGDRVCGNTDSIFWASEIGHHHHRIGETGITRQTAPISPPAASIGDAAPLDNDVYTPDSESSSEESEAPELTTTPGEETANLDPSSLEKYFIGETSCQFCDQLPKQQKIRKRVLAALHRENPVVWTRDCSGVLCAWVVVEGREYSARLEFIARSGDEAPLAGDSANAIALAGEWGVVASVNGSDMRISYSSAMNPILTSSISPLDALNICRRLSRSVFFQIIVELWLHSVLTACLPVLTRLVPPFDARSLTGESSQLCAHQLTRNTVDKLLHAFWVVSHFPSVSTACFAAAVRKTEPHITFPLATCGAFNGYTCESLYAASVGMGRLREAALLLVIIQERVGPVAVREQFAVPLFREALIVQDYRLGRDIAHFHFSLKEGDARTPSPMSRDFVWKPVDPSTDSFRAGIDTVVKSHLSHLANESMNWLILVRFVEMLRLDFGAWLSAIPRHEYLDVDQLVPSFRVVAANSGDASNEILECLVAGFKKARWVNHWNSVVVAFESVEGISDLLIDQSPGREITREMIDSLLGNHI